MHEILDRVANHLAGIDIDLKFQLNSKATSNDIVSAENKLRVVLPDSYIQFVTRFANGMQLSWGADDGSSTTIEIASLESSTNGLLSMRDWRFYDDQDARNYGFPHVDDPERALVINRLMHNWIPFYAAGNGDNFSINLNRNGFGNVVFDRHDWLDGGPGHNGIQISSDLPTFFESWSNICFAQPAKSCWASVIDESGVDWKSSVFDDRFRLNIRLL